MDWKRKSGTCMSTNDSPPKPTNWLNSDNTILKNVSIDNIKAPKTQHLKRMKNEKFEDNYTIECSDTDSNESYPLKKLKTSKDFNGFNKKKISTNSSKCVKKSVTHNGEDSQAKKKMLDNVNLLQDSFNCLDDTQTLIRKNVILNHKHVSSSKKHNSFIHKASRNFNCVKFANRKQNNDKIKNYPSTSEQDKIENICRNVIKLENCSTTTSSITNKNISLKTSLPDYILPDSQLQINSEFANDNPFTFLCNEDNVIEVKPIKKENDKFQFTQFCETTQFNRQLDKVIFAEQLPLVTDDKEAVQLLLATSNKDAELPPLATSNTGAKQLPLATSNKENNISNNEEMNSKNYVDVNSIIKNHPSNNEIQETKITNKKGNDMKIFKESSLDKDISSFLNTYIPNTKFNQKTQLTSNSTNRNKKCVTDEDKNSTTRKSKYTDENVIDKNICSISNSLGAKSKFTHKISDKLKVPIDFWNDISNIAVTQNFKTTQYKTDMEALFDQVETSIHEFGRNNTSIIRNQSDKITIEQILGKTFKSPEIIKNVLQNAEDSIKSSHPNIDWTDDTLIANAVINMSVEGQSIADIIKKALIENQQKSLSPQKQINKTLFEDESAFKEFGSFYGLPDTVKDLMKLYKGIDSLYEWQNECLNLHAIKTRHNLVYALPTSGGKTLVAEILILREIICRKKNVIFVLPYVAIVQEKVWSLSPFAVSLEFLIEEYAAGKGTLPPRKRRRKNSVFIATIEKALSLLNSLIEADRTDEIGLIVVDELHLIGDRSRGASLEALLTKVMFLKGNIQIIGMSATIGNISEISKFLNAEIYSKNFRPVELIEYVKCGNEIARVDLSCDSEDDVLIFDRKLDFRYAESVAKIDPDRIGGLVMEVIPKDSCLIFCRSKQNCENVAVLLCKVIFREMIKYKVNEKNRIKNALKDESGSICEVLKLSISYGVAYHHSGLTSEERRIIEEGFRQGVISVICCTSTLAAGVNLPAKRVIIRNPYIGRDFINLSRYKQMTGRAGRAGMGNVGESIIICTPEEVPKVRQVLMSPMDIAVSGMPENEAKGLRHFLLSCISLNLASTKSELQNIARHTLMAIQSDRLGVDIKKLTRDIIKELFKMGALKLEDEDSNPYTPTSNISVRLENTVNSSFSSLVDKSLSSTNINMAKPKTIVNITNDSKLVISKMGKAAIRGGFELGRAHMLYDDLLLAQSSIVLLTGLHLMFLVTPYDLSEQIKPSMAQYYTLHSQLNARETHTATVIGVTEAVASKMLSNKKIHEVPERVLNRFYVTLMLYDLWNEIPVYTVATKYGINRGLIQNLMTSAATFASNVVNFCEVFEEFWAFSLLLKGMRDRLSHCCVKELIPLMSLPSVKQNRAKQLYNAGYKTLQSIAKADADQLVQNIEFMSKKLANQLIAASKLILLEKVENLREEAEDVLDGVDI